MWNFGFKRVIGADTPRLFSFTPEFTDEWLTRSEHFSYRHEDGKLSPGET